MSNRPVTSINAKKRGTTRFLTGSTPSTCNASNSSRIFRAPRSAVIAVRATPANTIASTNGANSRMLARTKNPPKRSSAPNNTKKFAACRPGAPYPNATVETSSGNQHNFNAKRNWLTNSPPYGYGGRRADMIVLPVRIIMSPTSSSRFLTGKNPRSATERTKLASPLVTRSPEAYVTVGDRANQQPSYPTCAQHPTRCYVPASDGVGDAASGVVGSAGRAGRRRLRRRRASGRERAGGHVRRRRRPRVVPAGAARRPAVAPAHPRAQLGQQDDPQCRGHVEGPERARQAGGARRPQPRDLDHRRGPEGRRHRVRRDVGARLAAPRRGQDVRVARHADEVGPVRRPLRDRGRPRRQGAAPLPARRQAGRELHRPRLGQAGRRARGPGD